MIEYFTYYIKAYTKILKHKIGFLLYDVDGKYGHTGSNIMVEMFHCWFPDFDGCIEVVEENALVCWKYMKYFGMMRHSVGSLPPKFLGDKFFLLFLGLFFQSKNKKET